MQRNHESGEISSLASSNKIRKRRSTSGIRYNIYHEQKFVQNQYVPVTDRVKYTINTPEPFTEHAEDSGFYKLLLQHTWTLFRLSPLYNIKYTKVKLKQYAAFIKQSLARNIQDNNNNIAFNATVSTIFQEDKSELLGQSLQIEITQKKGDSDPQLKYRAILLCAESTTPEHSLTQVPLLLCTGTLSIMRIVHNTLQECFSTVIRPLKLCQDNLMWLSLLSNLKLKKNKKVELTYTYPQLSTKSNRHFLQFFVDANSLQCLWDQLHSPESEEIFFEEVDKFYSCLNTELTNAYNINLELLTIDKIHLVDMTIHSAGKIKFHYEESTMKILDFLVSIAIILEDTEPTMGFKNE